MGAVAPPPQQRPPNKADKVAPGAPKEAFGLCIHEPHETPPVDITDQVTQYFKLDAKVAKDGKASDEKKPEVVAASFTHNDAK